MKGSPLYRDTTALCGVLLQELETETRFPFLRKRLADGVLLLVDQVTLALAGFRRLDRVLDADAELRTLRTHLRLAFELGLFEEGTFLDLAEQSDTIGRQVGGWLKKLRRDAGDVVR